ncbi:MAG: TolC family outer membrane protein [Sphingomonadaceae bacterium]
MNVALRILLLGSALATPGIGSAETLRAALQKAYLTNPTLTGARAQQRSLDETVPINRAQGLPSANASATFTENVEQSSTSFLSPERQLGAQVQLNVPLYAGGGIRNAVRAAQTRVEAGRAELRDTEASLFSQVVGAYMDVIRDEAIVGLQTANVGVLRVNLEATRDRFQVGDLTRTDVAQSEARLALARSQLEGAQAQLITSREQYVRLVGEPPVALEPPPPLPNLPTAPQTAVTVALENNPALRSAQRQREATRFDVGVARASRLPQVAAVGTSNYSNFLNTLGSSNPNTSRSSAVGVQATLPLFQGGGPAAQVRRAQARESQAIEAVTEVERLIVAQTRSAYASWRASNENIVSSQAAVDANTLSLEGVRAENSVGTRTILDILNAEQELLNSQVNLVSSRRNAYVAGFTLLAAMGQAEARDLGLEGGALYDPIVNYERVKSKIWDFDDDPKPSPVATRTVDTPAQTPAVTGPVLP